MKQIQIDDGGSELTNQLPPITSWKIGRFEFGLNLDLAENLATAEAGLKKWQAKSNEVRFFIRLAEKLLNRSLGPIVADIGAGRGIATAVLAKAESIDRVFAVEYSRNLLEVVQPELFKTIPSVRSKIQRVHGDFNKLELADNSLDGIIAFGSLHHSFDIRGTMSEIFRTLKPNGVLLGIERSHPNEIKQATIERLLDKEYPPEWKRKYRVPEGVVVTRRDYGEHEYRDREWLKFLTDAGFASYLIHQGKMRMVMRGEATPHLRLLRTYNPLFRLWLRRERAKFLPKFGRKKVPTLLLALKPSG